MNGKVLNFYLAGINNQNFLMRDRETGTWWQQISGEAIYGLLRGAKLEPVASDELTLGEWKSETSDGKVLAPVGKDAAEYDSNWEPEVAKLLVVISFPGTGLKSRDVVLGMTLAGAARAYAWEAVIKQSPILDTVNGMPVLLTVGPDGKSFRAFVRRVNGKDAEFFLKSESANWTLLDTASASEWNFQGCATTGPSAGHCLERIQVLKDYWFDWRNYHPATTVYKH